MRGLPSFLIPYCNSKKLFLLVILQFKNHFFAPYFKKQFFHYLRKNYITLIKLKRILRGYENYLRILTSSSMFWKEIFIITRWTGFPSFISPTLYWKKNHSRMKVQVDPHTDNPHKLWEEIYSKDHICQPFKPTVRFVYLF